MSAVLKIPEVASLLDVSRNTAYEQAKTGEICGSPVLKVGRRLVVPKAPLMKALGIEDEASQ